MQRFLKNRFRSSLIIISIFLVLLLWIPLLWNQELRFVKADFATEYYKTLVDILKIFIGFWLVHFLLLNFRKDEFLFHHQKEWLDEAKKLQNNVQQVHKISDGSSVESVGTVMGNIQVNFIRMDYLVSLSSSRLKEFDLGVFGSMTFIYEHELRDHILRILKAFDDGEILPKRPLSPEINQSVTILTEKLSNFI